MTLRTDTLRRAASCPFAARHRRVGVVIAGLTLLLVRPAEAAPFNDWAWRQGIEVSAPGLARAGLPEETFDASQASLADLRLVDPAGGEVPYLIEQPRPASRGLRRAEGWQVFLEANRTRIELDVAPRGRLAAISLETPAFEFLKAATLTGTADGVRRAVSSGYPLFRQRGGATQLQFRLPEGAWTHLTFILNDARSKPIPITGVLLHEEETSVPPPDLAPAALGERSEGAGETRLMVDLGAARLPLAGLRFETTEPLFIRRVDVLTRQWENGEVRERVLGSGTLYRVAVEGQTNSAQLDLLFEAQPPSREVVIVIDNGDSPPLPVSSVVSLRRPIRMVFLARQEGSFRLYSGNPRAPVPRYDLAELSAQLRRAIAASFTPGKLEANPDYHPAEPLPEIPLFAAALEVRPWPFRRPVKPGPGGVQQLELTPHVLAHAQAGLGDLRLVASGRQVPFVLERAGFSRALVPEVSHVEDPKQPRLGRWSIRLPQERLPITRLGCESKASLFQRDVQVFEEVSNSRGERYPRVLGSASWVRRADGNSGRLVVVLSSPPQTGTLTLQMDHGDNPAIELEKFQVFLPVTRLLFKAPPGEPVELCYGNRNALAPSYDLDLVTPRILAAAKAEATLADIDPSGPAARAGSGWNTSFIFLGVLALVVVVLVAVITRLLPRAAPPA